MLDPIEFASCLQLARTSTSEEVFVSEIAERYGPAAAPGAKVFIAEFRRRVVEGEKTDYNSLGRWVMKHLPDFPPSQPCPEFPIELDPIVRPLFEPEPQEGRPRSMETKGPMVELPSGSSDRGASELSVVRRISKFVDEFMVVMNSVWKETQENFPLIHGGVFLIVFPLVVINRHPSPWRAILGLLVLSGLAAAIGLAFVHLAS